MPIHILPPEIASQIAAGEVIERPASVLKELIENSLDAGASFIHVKVEGAGRRLVEVADDGIGIPGAELPLAVERHATSKLTRSEELFHISTLGFRGEALASIGSVARLTITSRTKQADSANRLIVEGGFVRQIVPVGAPQGTLVRVEDLFFNVPARLKFLKHENTERRLIDLVAARYAMAYPRVRFQLFQDGRLTLQTSGDGEGREALSALYGPEIARQLLGVQADDDDIQISGFISPATLTRSNRRELTFFVNKRPVQDLSLATAVLKAYRTMLMVGRYPIAALFLDVPAESIDVNVHPTKAEVRFREPDRVFSGVQRAVRRALLAYTPIPGLGDPLQWGAPPARRQIDLGWEMATNLTPALNQNVTGEFEPETIPDQTSDQAPQPSLPGSHLSILRPVGQIANAYLVAEGPDGLYLIDQHAAHERILFEKFTRQANERIPSQALLNPSVVELAPATSRLLEGQLPTLAGLGFSVEVFGVNSFIIRAIPAFLSGSDPGEAIRVIVEDFEEDETPLQAHTGARLIARICKRAAIKAGKSLSIEEQRALISDLESCQWPRTCPHGRPTMIHLSVDLLERQFGRRGAR